MSSTTKKILLILAAIVVASSCTCVSILGWLGTKGPDITVIPGSQMRVDHMEVIDELGLLEPEERIVYFYSDALLDIRDGMYMVTDRNVILYVEDWAEPKAIIPLDEITEVEATLDDSFFLDSQIRVYSTDGMMHMFPMSSTDGGDRRVLDHLLQRVEANRAAAAREANTAGETPPPTG